MDPGPATGSEGPGTWGGLVVGQVAGWDPQVQAPGGAGWDPQIQAPRLGADWQPLCKHPPALQDICWLPALGTRLSVHLHVEILGVRFTLNKEKDSSLSGSRV